MPAESVVTVASYGPTGSSARVRIIDWLAHCRIDAERHQYLGTSDNQPATLLRSPLRTLRAERDLRELAGHLGGRSLILSRRASPFSRGRLEEALLRAARVGIYDVDDALYADTGGLTRAFWPPREVWARSVAAADTVIAGNDTVADRAASGGANVVVIPSCVAPESYRRKADYEMGETPRAIWIGSPSTERHLLTISHSLRALHDRLGLRLTVISAGRSSLGELDRMIDRREWGMTDYADALAAADFGIMPLADTEFTRGKCAYKLLQYGAAGLPVVGSPVGASTAVLAALGGIPAGDADWVDAITALVEASPAERERAGAAARRGVETGYSYTAWESRWRAVTGL